jgi:amidase
MVPLADGSDMGGSLRNPAAFCNVVGLRPSMGRVPLWPTDMAWQSRIAVEGPMARTVKDCALLLSAMAGPDNRDPLSLPDSAETFTQSLERDFSGARIGWSADLGFLPVERSVAERCEGALSIFRDLGCQLDREHPDLRDAMGVFEVLRASYFAQSTRAFFEQQRANIKDTAVWNIEQGLSLSGADITAADVKRTAIYHQFLDFFKRYDFLVLPATQVAPFDGDIEWVREIEGVQMQTYLDWMQICCVISITGLPAISVPCGFTAEGLPVGLQIVGKPQSDLEVLQLASAFEQATQFGRQRRAL